MVISVRNVIIKIGIKNMNSFYKRLELLGYSNYDEYLKSDHWKEIKEQYKNSDFPQHCLVCHNDKYVLHHRSYVRLGDESLYDFVPLCKNCHQKVHNYLKENKIDISATHVAIRKIFNLTQKQTRELFNQISKGKPSFKFRDSTKKDILKEEYKKQNNNKKMFKYFYTAHDEIRSVNIFVYAENENEAFEKAKQAIKLPLWKLNTIEEVYKK